MNIFQLPYEIFCEIFSYIKLDVVEELMRINNVTLRDIIRKYINWLDDKLWKINNPFEGNRNLIRRMLSENRCIICECFRMSMHDPYRWDYDDIWCRKCDSITCYDCIININDRDDKIAEHEEYGIMCKYCFDEIKYRKDVVLH